MVTKISRDVKDSLGMVKTMHFPQPFPFVLESMKPIIEKVENEETEKEKYKAITKKIEDCIKNNQPVLVGTTSIEKSEKISQLLKAKKNRTSSLYIKYWGDF